MISDRHTPDNEQRFDQNGQVREVLDKLLDARLEHHRPDHPDLEAEVAQGGAQVVLDGDSSLLWVSSIPVSDRVKSSHALGAYGFRVPQ